MRRYLSNLLRLAVLASVVLMTAVATPASAATGPNVGDQVRHYIECATWLLTDPVKHEKYCSPAAPYFDPWPKNNGGGSDPCVERKDGYIDSDYSYDCECPTAQSYSPNEVFPELLFVQSQDCGCFSGTAFRTPDADLPWLLNIEQVCPEGNASFDMMDLELPQFLI